MKKIVLIAAVLALSVFIASTSGASTVTGSFQVSANVVSTCQVQSPMMMNFGSVTGLQSATTSGTISVNCVQGTNYNVALDAGLNYGSGPLRKISGGTYSTGYYLYKPDGLTEWGDATPYANTYPAGTAYGPIIGDGTFQTYSVHATLPAFTGIPSGTFLQDTVTVTVYY